MDDLHSEIFGRPGVTGGRVLTLCRSFNVIHDALKELDNEAFAYYTLTRYFIAYAVMRIIRDDAFGMTLIDNLDSVATHGKLEKFVSAFSELAKAAANDLNAEVSADDDVHFDYKTDLKSSKWCKQTAARLLAQYKKDAQRRKAEPISEMFADI